MRASKLSNIANQANERDYQLTTSTRIRLTNRAHRSRGNFKVASLELNGSLMSLLICWILVSQSVAIWQRLSDVTVDPMPTRRSLPSALILSPISGPQLPVVPSAAAFSLQFDSGAL